MANLRAAVILAGGAATRLRPISDSIPKAMVELGGKPLLEWIVDWLRDNEVRQLVIGVAYRKEDIIEYFGDGSRHGVDIIYSHHAVEGGTGEGFRLAISRFVHDENFFAMNGDQITDLNLSKLADFHVKASPLATIAVINPRSPFGHVEFDDHMSVTSFLEKPILTSTYMNTGIYAFNRRILEYLPGKGDVEKIAFPRLVEERKIKVYPYNGLFITVNTPKDIAEAEAALQERHIK